MLAFPGTLSAPWSHTAAAVVSRICSALWLSASRRAPVAAKTASQMQVETGPSTTTTVDRDALGLNTDTYCGWDTKFVLDEWTETATPSDAAKAEALLEGLPLSDFFIQATTAETQQACELFDGELVVDP